MDVTTIVLAAMAGLAVMAYYSNLFFKYRKALAEYKSTNPDWIKEDYALVPRIVGCVLIAIALAALIYGLVISDLTFICLGVLMLLLFSADLLLSGSRFTLYHDNKTFFGGNEAVPYVNVRGFTLNKAVPTIGFVTVSRFAGPTFKICAAAYRYIQNKLEQDKLQKKEQKEARKKHAA